MLPELELLLELLDDEDGRSSIQGTATCFPLEELPELLDRPEELPLGLLLPPELLELLLPRLLLEELGLLELPDDEPLGLLLLPELPLEFSDSTAKSMRPEVGLMIVSLTVPRVSPEEPVTLAPISWLARSSWPLMRPIAPQ